MLNRSKTNEILKGEELLRVSSLSKPISKGSRKIVFAISTFAFVLILSSGSYMIKDAPTIIRLYFLGGFTGLYFLVMLLTFILGSAKENALVITERGLAFWPIVAEKWEDIESYSWEAFKGINRVPGPTVFSSCEGVTLRIMIKGLFQRCLESRTNHSIFATYLIFFSPEQVTIAEGIIKQHGIRKTE